MKKLKYLTVALLAVLIASCGGSKDGKSVTLTVETELGELSNYMSVTDTEVTIVMNEKGSVAASLGFNVTKAVASNFSYSFDVEVLDKNHIKIADLTDLKIEEKYDSDNGDLRYTLLNGTTRAEMDGYVSDSDWDKISSEGVYVRIKPDYDSAKYATYKGGSIVESSDESSSEVDETADADETTDVSEANSGDNSYDEMLDSYEEFVDQYIKLMKKAKQGDMSATTEYMDYLQKAQELGEKMANAKGDLTAKQLARYTKIMAKMAKAAQ